MEDIKQLVKDLLKEDWMNEEDYLEFEKELLNQGILDYELLDKQIQEGVNNGYDEKLQFRLIKQLIK